MSSGTSGDMGADYGHAKYACTFDYTQHMQAEYGPESVEKQCKQAKLNISGPQTLIKQSLKVMGCSSKWW